MVLQDKSLSKGGSIRGLWRQERSTDCGILGGLPDKKVSTGWGILGCLPERKCTGGVYQDNSVKCSEYMYVVYQDKRVSAVNDYVVYQDKTVSTVNDYVV